MTAAPTIGVGLEIAPSIVRAVMVDVARPDAVVAAEYAVDTDDDDALHDAFVRASGLVPFELVRRVPARLAIAFDDLLIQSLDVTGRDRDEIVQLAVSATSSDTADSMTLVDDGRRHRLGLVRGHATRSARLVEIARRAGFGGAEVEPGPVALGRSLPSGRILVRRSVDPTTVWTALFDDGWPLVAAAGPTGFAGWPNLTTLPGPKRQDDPETLLGAGDLLGFLDDLVERVRQRHSIAADQTDADGWPVEPPQLSQAGTLHPMFPTHDLRSSSRIGVALGAAVGAAGAAERHRRIERLAPLRPVVRPARRPWAIEAIEVDATPRSPMDDQLGEATASRHTDDVDDGRADDRAGDRADDRAGELAGGDQSSPAGRSGSRRSGAVNAPSGRSAGPTVQRDRRVPRRYRRRR